MEAAGGKRCFYLRREAMVLGASSLSKRTLPNEHLCFLIWYYGNSTEVEEGRPEALSISVSPRLCDRRQGT